MAQTILVDSQAAAQGAKIQAEMSAVVPASDYTWFLYGRSEMPIDRLFYWQTRILDRARSLYNSSKIDQNLYNLIQKLAFAGLLWVPRWRGSGDTGHQAAVALFDLLGFMAIRNEYVAEAVKYTAKAGAKLARNAALYDIAYKTISVISVAEQLKQLRAAAATLSSTMQSVREMENRANNSLPPSTAASFISTYLAPVKSDFSRAETMIRESGLTNQEAGLGWINIALGVTLAIVVLGVVYLAGYAQRKAADARDVLAKMIADSANLQEQAIEKKYEMMIDALPGSTPLAEITKLEAQRDLEIAKVKDEAAKKLKEALNIPLPKSGLPSFGELGFASIAVGGLILLFLLAPSFIGKH